MSTIGLSAHVAIIFRHITSIEYLDVAWSVSVSCSQPYSMQKWLNQLRYHLRGTRVRQMNHMYYMGLHMGATQEYDWTIHACGNADCHYHYCNNVLYFWKPKFNVALSIMY